MKPLHAFYIAALLGVGLGWFGIGLVECGAIFLGAVIVVFAAERAHNAEATHRSSAWWIGALVLGASIAVAGAFDVVNAAWDTEFGDWETGFLLGLVLLGPIALLHLWIRRRRGVIVKREGAGLVVLVAGVVATEFVASFLAYEPSTLGRTGYATIAAAVGFGASVFAQIRAGKSPRRPRLFGDLAAAALIATGLAFPGMPILVSIGLFGVAWGIAMLGVTYSHPERAQGTAYGVFKRSAVTGAVNAVLLCVIIIGAFAPRADRSIADAVAMLDDVVPLPQSVFARLMMSDRYLWARVPVADRGGLGREPRDFIEARRHPSDKWSSALPATLSKAISRGETSEGVDYVEEDGESIVGHVHPESPAAAAGVKRGWRFATGWQSATGRRLFFMDPDGAAHGVELPGPATYLPASWWIVVEHAGHKVGYLYLSSFRRPRLEQLSSSFAALKREGVDDLVLDLRYNRGGSLDAAQRLTSLIAGPALEGEVFQRVIHNEKYRDRDYTSRFEPHAEALGLKRVFVLTTKSTCSASEAVIKGLAPHIEVITIGGTTCGKPVGFAALDYRDVSYWVIDFRLRNAAGEGDYFDGLAPTCRVKDDLRHNLGATDEALFAEALHYMSTGGCSES